MAPGAGGGVLCGRRAPRLLPGRTGRRGGGGAEAGRRAAGPRGRGSEGRHGWGFPHLPAATWGPGPPQAGEGDGSVSRIALCAARRRPQLRPGGFVLARPGRGPGASTRGRSFPGLARRCYRGPSAAAAAASCSSRSACLSARAGAAAAAR